MHRRYLTTVCVWEVTFDDGLRQRLLVSEPGTEFYIDGAGSPAWVQRLVRGLGLRYRMAVARKMSPTMAVVAYWAAEFPGVRDEAVIFSGKDFNTASLPPLGGREVREGREAGEPLTETGEKQLETGF